MVPRLTLRKDQDGITMDGSITDAVEGLPFGRYHIHIQRFGYRITTSQRKLFWMWMTCLEDWSGSTRQEWHDYFVGKYLEPMHGGIRVLSTVAMTHFLEQIQAEAATEYAFQLPLPEDHGADYNQFVLEYMYR